MNEINKKNNWINYMLDISYSSLFFGFLTGLFLIGIFHKKEKVIIQYPTPTNAGKIIYKDMQDKCFKYHSIRTKCSNKNKIILPSM
jgi:hypothetical protein